jgi:cytidylate kinase
MPLIAITREMGSAAESIAARLGEALGVPVIHHEIIDYLADKMRLRRSHVIKLLEGRASLFEKLTADQTSLSIYTAAETLALAARSPGAVFLSWGAANLLASVPHAVRLRVCAPLALRCARVKRSIEAEDDDYVSHEIEASDEAHAAIIRRHFSVSWRDPEHYDLVLNTARLSADAAAAHVLELVRSAEFAESDASRSRLADLSLEAHVRGALRQSADTARLRVSVSADAGRVLLTGSVPAQRDSREAERIALALPGVDAVENRLVFMSSARPQYAD